MPVSGTKGEEKQSKIFLKLIKQFDNHMINIILI